MVSELFTIHLHFTDANLVNMLNTYFLEKNRLKLFLKRAEKSQKLPVYCLLQKYEL